MCNTKRRYIEAGGRQTKFQMRCSVRLGVYRNEALTEIFREPQGVVCEYLYIRAGHRMVGEWK
jgi:hypothetical protein